MKYLLHSKKFKMKLAKWLGMYFGVICLLTAVITYSRYISEASRTDTARAASFKIVVSDGSNCETITSSNTSLCSLDNMRPQEYIDYYFNVDTTGLEVKADYQLTMKVSEPFELYQLYDITEGETLIANLSGQNYNSSFQRAEPGTGTIKKYKLKIKYTKLAALAEQGIYNKISVSEAVYIGYSATQVD